MFQPNFFLHRFRSLFYIYGPERRTFGLNSFYLGFTRIRSRTRLRSVTVGMVSTSWPFGSHTYRRSEQFQVGFISFRRSVSETLQCYQNTFRRIPVNLWCCMFVAYEAFVRSSSGGSSVTWGLLFIAPIKTLTAFDETMHGQVFHCSKSFPLPGNAFRIVPRSVTFLGNRLVSDALISSRSFCGGAFVFPSWVEFTCASQMKQMEHHYWTPKGLIMF